MVQEDEAVVVTTEPVARAGGDGERVAGAEVLPPEGDAARDHVDELVLRVAVRRRAIVEGTTHRQEGDPARGARRVGVVVRVDRVGGVGVGAAGPTTCTPWPSV